MVDRYIEDIHRYVYRYTDNLPVINDGIYTLGNQHGKQKAAKLTYLAS